MNLLQNGLDVVEDKTEQYLVYKSQKIKLQRLIGHGVDDFLSAGRKWLDD